MTTPTRSLTPIKIRLPVATHYGTGREGFMAWLRDTQPDNYRALVSLYPDMGERSATESLDTHLGVGDLTDSIDLTNIQPAVSAFDPSTLSIDPPPIISPSQAVQVTPGGTDWVQTVTNVLTPLANAYSQVQLNNVQLQRAAKGLPPLNTAAYQNASSLKAGLDPATQKTVLMVGGMIVLGFLGFGFLSKRR
jgi:hypothetical protein